MSTAIEIYDALRRVGLEDRIAQDIADSVGARAEAATKHDLALFQEDVRGQFRELKGLSTAASEGLRRELADVKADLTARLVVMTGIFIAAVSALRILT
jgi:hypothetical protein